MPYIKQYDRERARKYPKNSGELNYAITCTVLDTLQKGEIRYSVLNDIVSDLERLKDWSGNLGPEKDLDLNYPGMGLEIVSLISTYRSMGKENGKQVYGAMSNVIGEFRRRVIDPYENEKIESNGDVY